MALEIENPNNPKKPLYVHGRGKYYYLSITSKGALDNMPDGWRIVEIKGKKYLKKEA